MAKHKPAFAALVLPSYRSSAVASKTNTTYISMSQIYRPKPIGEITKTRVRMGVSSTPASVSGTTTLVNSSTSLETKSNGISKKHVIKTAALTGAAIGAIGYEAARGIALKYPDVELYVLVRDVDKGNAVKAELEREFPESNVVVIELDLADLTNVHPTADKIAASLQDKPLDLLINCAGIMACPFATTKQGYEMQLGVNHLAHVALTQAMLPYLRKSQNKGGGRVVNLSSLAAYGSEFNFIFSEDFKKYMTSPNSYQRWRAYCNSKYANAAFATGLNAMEQGQVTSYSVHPGIVNTFLFRHLVPSWLFNLLKNNVDPNGLLQRIVTKMLGQKTPEEGAENTVYTSMESYDKLIPGGYYIEKKARSLNQLNANNAVKFVKRSIAEIEPYIQ